MESRHPQLSAESDHRAPGFDDEGSRSSDASDEARPREVDPLTLAIAAETDIIHHGLRRMLSGRRDMRVVWESTTAGQTVAMIRRRPPRVLLLDPGLACTGWSDSPSFTDRGMGVVVLARDRTSHLHLLPHHAIRLDRAAGRMELIRTIHTADLAVTEARRTLRGEPPPGLRDEQRILALMAGGSTNRQIARSLGVSEDKVKADIKALFARWHVSSRSEAVVRAIRLGVID